MRRLGAAVVVAIVAAGGLSTGTAFADDMKMGPGATCSPAGTSLMLTAQDHKFDKDCLAVPAGQAFTVEFDNKDSDRHNVAILPSHMATTTFFQGDIVMGPKSIRYSVPALKPGTWHFHCEIHPNLMNGTFIVGDAKSAPAPAQPPMSMDKPVTAPAASTAPTPAPAAPMPKAAASATPAPAPVPKAAMPDLPSPRASAGAAAGAAATPKPAGSPLPRTGPQSSRLLLLTAGLALAAGGLSVLAGARRAATEG
ncbi:MAG TPA: cupredoxin domain-containing protein [Acidimicrobiia bacterium]